MNVSSTGVRLRVLRSAFGLVAVAVVAIALAACGSSGGSSSSTEVETGSGGSTSTTSDTTAGGPTCGAGTHKPATGQPVTLGAIVTKQSGVDFSGEANGVEAYFKCINENGGAAGRPLSLKVIYEQSNPQEEAADATKLLDTESVLGMVGNMSLSECAVNEAIYQKEGIYVIGPGVNASCFQQPNFASTIGGPIFDMEAAAKYLLTQFGADSGFVAAQTQCPGCLAFTEGAVQVAEAEGVSSPKSSLTPSPIANPSALALQLASEAGDGGSVVLGFTGPELTKILNAASQQNLQERVHWGCVALCSSPESAEALESAWEENVFSSSNYQLPGSGGETKLLEEVISTYGGEEMSGLNEMGLVTGLIAGTTLAEMKPNELTRTGVNAAFKGIKNFKTDVLCTPWSYSEQPISEQRIFTLKEGEFVEAEGCVKPR